MADSLALFNLPDIPNVQLESWSDGGRHGVSIHRADGVELSCIFGFGSYTNNRDELHLTFEQALLRAEAVEVMAIGADESFMWPDVVGWVTKEQLAELIAAPDVLRWYNDHERGRTMADFDGFSTYEARDLYLFTINTGELYDPSMYEPERTPSYFKGHVLRREIEQHVLGLVRNGWDGTTGHGEVDDWLTHLVRLAERMYNNEIGNLDVTDADRKEVKQALLDDALNHANTEIQYEASLG